MTKTTETILDAAIALSKEHGYTNISLLDIATRAGVSRPLIHYYFRNRMILIDMILSEAVMRREYTIIAQALSIKDPLLDASEEIKAEARLHI